FRDPFAGLEHIAYGFVDWERPLLGQHRLEVLALQVLHHQEGLALVAVIDVEDADRVLATQFRRGSRFSREALYEVAAVRRLRAKQLDRDALTHAKVRRQNDDAHAARAEHTLDAVFRAQHVPRSERERGDVVGLDGHHGE